MEKKQKQNPSVLVQAEIPPYPANEKDGTIPSTEEGPKFSGAEDTVKEEPQIVIDTKQLSCDLVGMAGKMWHAANKRVPEFSTKEIQDIALPMAAVIEKYDLTKYMKYFGYTQEMLLVYNTFNVIAPRIKELKKPVSVITDDGTDD